MKKHGMSGTSEYGTWSRIKERCYSKKYHKYHRYGGRGIKVCERWKNSFENFYEDMGNKPFHGAQIDRIDNDGNYEPSNCEWVTLTQNTRHSCNVKLTMIIARLIRKSSLTRRHLATKYNVSRQAIDKIINNQRWVEGA